MSLAVPSFEEVMLLTRTVSSPAAFEDEECKAYYDLLVTVPEGETILEVGLQFGRSSSIAGQVAKARRLRYMGIDPFTDPPEALGKWVVLMQVIGVPFELHCMKTIDAEFHAEPYLALIDADHSRESVLIDCDLVLSQVRKYALFHDYGRDSLPEVMPSVRYSFGMEPRSHYWQERPSVGTLGIWERA